MTPKEKAEDLYSMFNSFGKLNDSEVKECVLIAVDEILNTLQHEDLWIRHESNIDDFIIFWQKVKQEIEKI